MSEFILNAERVMAELNALYPTARAELIFSNPYETLVATILSAQCTDKRVNQVTEKLFKICPDAFAMAKLEPVELEPLIKDCGIYHNKAKNIVAACREIVSKYDGVVPSTREKLMALPGVGQKTAGVVLLAAFGADEIPVDTHVFRVANRIGLTNASTADETERQLRRILPEGTRSKAHHLLIWHGRRVCHARKPDCGACPLSGGLCKENTL